MMRNRSLVGSPWSLAERPSFLVLSRGLTRVFMRIAYLDCFSGMSGDMFLGALVDAGVPARLFEETIAALNVGGRLDISRVDRSGVTATKVDVYVNGEKELPREVYWEQRAHKHEHPHGHEHHHSHDREPVALREHNFSRTQAVEDAPPETRSGMPAPSS